MTDWTRVESYRWSTRVNKTQQWHNLKLGAGTKEVPSLQCWRQREVVETVERGVIKREEIIGWKKQSKQLID